MKKLNINDEIMPVQADNGTPLLWVLRDELNKKGTKFGCGKGLCGSCTVLVDGVATRSCVTPIETLIDKKITTIEGLSVNGDHPLQKAWKDENVPQCGYCQPGQIMNALGLLKLIPKPSKEDIRNHMAGNICRCGTYQRIEKAILIASKYL
ncbi:MAG: (2Fe-2S)-binding protein [Halobacteriovoraceae bacterium]|jgi:isoquinoline 1-oxidoreductase subunit alpha|nr:(2Fe-2S)-binding protein [Halobacteriovoraceae bacterium]